MKELEIEGYKYSVNYHEGAARQIVIDQILIKYSENWYHVDLNSEAGRKVKEIIESQHVFKMKSAEAIVVLIFSNRDGSNIQLNGPFQSSVMTPGGKLISVDNKAVMLAARMNALKGLN